MWRLRGRRNWRGRSRRRCAGGMDSNLMHAVMLTSQPALTNWRPEAVRLMQAIRRWREQGQSVCYTVDAGPNVHCLCLGEQAEQVRHQLESLVPEARMIRSGPGGPAPLG